MGPPGVPMTPHGSPWVPVGPRGAPHSYPGIRVLYVLLLTPGLLSRPWCLLEIVTAIDSGVVIVPVEVQRPGIKSE